MRSFHKPETVPNSERILSKYPPQREYDRAKTDRIIVNEMVSRSMSDAKWVRLLNALSETIDPSISITVQLVWDDEPRTMWIRDAQYNFDYYPTSMEAMVGGFPRGWYDYNEIEYVTFGATMDCCLRSKSKLTLSGCSTSNCPASALRLYAYRRGASAFRESGDNVRN